MQSIKTSFYFVLLLSVAPFYQLAAQNIDMIGNAEKPFMVNGGLSVNQVFSLTSDSLSQRDPYNYYLAGNINFSLYGWSVPFSFMYSNQKATFTQPFNQYSLHPSYKWVQTHIGYTSMSFSPYTLSGHQFLGAGVELNPTAVPLRFAAMYGRLQKAVEYDTNNPNQLPPAYERYGYGMKIGYNLQSVDFVKADMEVTVFKARDEAGSLAYMPDSLFTPGENMALSTNINLSFKPGFRVGAELASSAVTSNTQSNFENDGPLERNVLFSSIYAGNATTQFFNAMKFHAAWGTELYTLGLGYQRIDPGYQTYGAYYFNNDLENVTVNGSINLFEKKLNLSANIGRQRDNLDNAKSSEMDRWVMAYNASFNSGERLNASLSYSTFTSHTNIKSNFDAINSATPYDNLDTLNFTQLSASTSGNVAYTLRNTEQVRQNLAFNMSFQRASEKQGGVEVGGGSEFYNMNGSFNHTLVPAGLTISGIFTASINQMPDMRSTTLGPSVAVNKLMFDKKLRNTLACSYNNTYSGGSEMSRVLSLRLNSSYRLGKRHSFTLGITGMNRKNKAALDAGKGIRELVGNLNYNFNF